MSRAPCSRRTGWLLALVAVVAACSDDGVLAYSPEAPTQAEAEAILDQAVRLARADDVDGLCQLTDNELGALTRC